MSGKKNKKITLEVLATKMGAGFKRSNANHEALARMVAKGFENTATKADIARLDGRMDKLEKEMTGLRGSVNNYLRLTDRRYLEQENKLKIVAKYLKVIIQKFKIPVDLRELEMVLK